MATHGRGIWIIDDITPLRALTPNSLKQDVAFVSARPVQQRIEGQGGWANGDAVFVGENPPDAAVINYYQRERHLFGKMKLEVLGSSGRVVDRIAGQQTAGLESGDVDDAGKTAARAACCAGCSVCDSRSAPRAR